jgi:hypothetical protein
MPFKEIIAVFFLRITRNLNTRYKNPEFLGAFPEWRKSTINCFMSVCLPIRLSVHVEQLGSRWTDFHEI